MEMLWDFMFFLTPCICLLIFLSLQILDALDRQTKDGSVGPEYWGCYRSVLKAEPVTVRTIRKPEIRKESINRNTLYLP